MRITQETDYAIRIMTFLYNENKKTDAKTIASSLNIPLRFALKILRRLVMGGAVTSFKGVRGGYLAAKSPDSLSFYDVIEIIEGCITINRCMGDDYVCSYKGADTSACTIRLALDDVNATIMDKLKYYTFDKVIL